MCPKYIRFTATMIKCISTECLSLRYFLFGYKYSIYKKVYFTLLINIVNNLKLKKNISELNSKTINDLNTALLFYNIFF